MKTSRFGTHLGSPSSSSAGFSGLQFSALASAALGTLLTVFSTSYVSTAYGQATPIQAVTPDPNGAISPERIKAQRIFQALTATKVPIDDTRVVQMEALLKAGNLKGAAAIATADPLFLDIQIRDTAKEMSTRDESVRAPMSDFVATMIGIFKDSDTTNGQDLVMGNYFYRVDPAIIATLPTNASVRQAELPDFVQSNNHYADMVTRNLSPKAVLIRQSPQRAMMGGVAVDHPDPAGLLSTRAFNEAHAVMGTNRRMYQYTFKEFMCLEMTEFADTSVEDDRVGRDVTRKPSGDNNVYATTCKGCHGQMDGFRGAFAKLDFNNNAITYSTNVVGKMNRNSTEAPLGWLHVDDSFVNYATKGKNAVQLGWRSPTIGNGLKDFGKTIGQSRAFSRCMAKRAFKRVCRRTPLASEESLLQSLATQFETDGYHLRHLWENVAIQPQCLQ